MNVSVSMVNDVCDPAMSYLLLYPVSDELSTPFHPRIDDASVTDDPNDPLADDRTVLFPGETDYQSIFNWVASGNCGL